MKQTSIEWLIDQLQQTRSWHRVLEEISQKSTIEIDIIEQAKEMEKEQSHQYAEFAIRCDRKDMKILNFEDFIKL